MEHSMSDPLGTLFDQFLKERTYLKAVTPKTRISYLTAWKAFQASQAVVSEGGLTRAQLQAFVIQLRDRGVKPRSVNTYLQALNAF
jgi:site-specific recombinase XerC